MDTVCVENVDMNTVSLECRHEYCVFRMLT